MLDVVTHWMRDVSLITGRYFAHLTPERYSHILLFILLVGWLMLRSDGRR